MFVILESLGWLVLAGVISTCIACVFAEPLLDLGVRLANRIYKVPKQ